MFPASISGRPDVFGEHSHVDAGEWSWVCDLQGIGDRQTTWRSLVATRIEAIRLDRSAPSTRWLLKRLLAVWESYVRFSADPVFGSRTTMGNVDGAGKPAPLLLQGQMQTCPVALAQAGDFAEAAVGVLIPIDRPVVKAAKGAICVRYACRAFILVHHKRGWWSLTLKWSWYISRG
jgi:hypothetical protein